MIEIFSHHTIHRFQDSYIRQAELRKRVFVDQLKWNLRSADGMEFDEYDTPHTTYIVYRDAAGVVRGCCRTIPTSEPYMIEEHFADFVRGAVPKQVGIVEVSRMCVDERLPLFERSHAFHELHLAGVEHNFLTGVKRTVALVSAEFSKTGRSGKGLRMDPMGDEHLIDGEPHVAVISEEITRECVERNRRFSKVEYNIQTEVGRQAA